MAVVRSFVAIQPDAAVLEALAAFSEELRESGADVRWIKPEAIHLTIKFLGEVPESELAGIQRALGESFGEQPPIELAAHGIGVFPNLKKPRVLWVGLESDGLFGLVERAEIALSPLGFPPEEREFTPHLTLGRFRSTRGWERLSQRVKDAREQSFGSCTIDHATLYRSQLRPDGAVYSPIEVFRFTR